MNAQTEQVMDWLLDSEAPGVRYRALREVAGLAADDPQVTAARQQALTAGPIAEVLAAMHPDGYWVKPGPGYGPKYTGTVWALILLAQLGAAVQDDPRIAAGCAYLLDHALAPGGQFTMSANGSPAGTADCVQGNLCWALTALGCTDPRLDTAYDWLARSVTGEGIAPVSDKQATERYYATGKCGPGFACAANNKQPCAWGAAKVLLALGALPAERRTPAIQRAIAAGMDFLLDNHPEQAGYPNGYAEKPSGNWWKFGFPVFYVSDILQIAEAAVALGYRDDPRLRPALDLIQSKADAAGRWPLEYYYHGKTYGEYGKKKEPNPWVTLRAWKVVG